MMAKKRKRLEQPLFVNDQPKSFLSVMFRGIRSKIMFSWANDEFISLIVTSEKPAAGKSVISANIASTYAQAGYRTLIIDGDMRKPTQNYLFEVANYDGLSNLIIGKSDYDRAIRSTRVPNLDLLTSGPIPPNPSELIDSDAFHEIYNELLRRYDFVLIDTPPVNTVTDAQVYSQYVKDAIMVVDVEKNNKNEVKKAKTLIEKAGGKLIGAVLNKTPKDKTSSYYSYYGEEE